MAVTGELAAAVALDRRSTRAVAAAYGLSHSAVHRLRRRIAEGAGPPMPGPAVNAYTAPIDALDFLRGIPSGMVSAVITSPPYNRRRRRDGGQPNRGHTYKRQLLESGFDGFSDDMPWDDYVAGQREMLAAALELVGGKDGAGIVMYQYQIGQEAGLESWPEADILAGFPVRQRIVWQVPGTGGPTANEGLPRNYRLIALITGRHWRLPARARQDKHIRGGSVWRIMPDLTMQHPAAFPLELAITMCRLAPDGGAIADCYAGSGTIGIAAHRLGRPWYLGDISLRYRDDFQRRLAAETPPLIAGCG